MVDALHKFIYEDMPPTFEGMDELSDSPVVPFEGFVSADSGAIEKKWGFKQIEPCLKPAPEFDGRLLPDAFVDYVADAAYRMQVSPDYMAVTLMVSLSIVVGRKIGIHPKQLDNWLVVPNLWGCIVGRPSAKKSPSLGEAMQHLDKLEGDGKKEYEQALKKYRSIEELATIKAKQAREDAKRAVAAGDDTKALAALTNGACIPEQPIRRRYKTNSCTVEKLGELLADNPTGVLVYRDELAGFLAEMNKQGHESDRAFYLECWTGRGSFTYDRIGRGTIDISSTCVSILGGIQPSKLKPFVDSAMNGGAGDDGFLQRFQLLVYPDKLKSVYIDQMPSKQSEQRAFDVFVRLSALQVEETIALRFSEAAQSQFIEWFNELDSKVNDPDIHPAIESHLDKYRSLVPSLALLIHLADSPMTDLLSPVSETALLKALAWSEYLEGHMHRVYGLSSSIDEDNAIGLARKFGGQLKGSFTLRDVKQANWQGIGRDEDKALAAISVLLDHGYIIAEQRSTNGRPTIDYVINEGVIGLHG